MGFILDLTETLKEPSGIIGLIVIIGLVYMLYKWISEPHPDDDE